MTLSVHVTVAEMLRSRNVLFSSRMLAHVHIPSSKWIHGSIMMKKGFLEKVPISRLEHKNMALFMTKTAEKPYPLGPHILS